LGMVSFWPWILGYRALWYQAGLVVLLVLLAALGVVRYRRVRGAFEARRQLAVRGQPPSGPERQ